MVTACVFVYTTQETEHRVSDHIVGMVTECVFMLCRRLSIKCQTVWLLCNSVLISLMRRSNTRRTMVVMVTVYVCVPQETEYQVSDRNVQITLTKEDGWVKWWPHLTRERTKLPWLRVRQYWDTETQITLQAVRGHCSPTHMPVTG